MSDLSRKSGATLPVHFQEDGRHDMPVVPECSGSPARREESCRANEP
jgi:hypothetical protein